MAQSAFTVGGSSSGGAGSLVSRQTATNSPQFNIPGISSAFLNYQIVLNNILMGTNDTFLNLTFNNDVAIDYDYAWIAWQATGAGPTNSAFAVSATSINLGNDFSNTRSFNGLINIYSPSASDYTMIDWQFQIYNGFANAFTVIRGGGARKISTAVTSIQLVPSSGVITSGIASLYGTT